MITCASCQTPNEDAAQYCDECGAALAAHTPNQPQAHTSSRLSRQGEAHGGGRTMPFTLVASAPTASTAATSFDADDRIQAENGVVDEVTHIATPAGGHVAASRQAAEVFAAQAAAAPEHGTLRSAGVDSRAASFKTAHAKLVIERGRSAGKGFMLDGAEAHIGRWDADGGIFPDIDLDADDPEAKVSRRHARIIRRADGYYIEDLGSTNGTFVNRGRRLLPGALQPLHDGDEIIVGKTFLRLHVMD